MQKKKSSFSEFEEIGIKGFGPSDKSMIFIIPTLVCAIVGIIIGMKKRIENVAESTESDYFDNTNTAVIAENENFRENFIEENDDDLYDRQNEDVISYETETNAQTKIPVVDPQQPLIDI